MLIVCCKAIVVGNEDHSLVVLVSVSPIKVLCSQWWGPLTRVFFPLTRSFVQQNVCTTWAAWPRSFHVKTKHRPHHPGRRSMCNTITWSNSQYSSFSLPAIVVLIMKTRPDHKDRDVSFQTQFLAVGSWPLFRSGLGMIDVDIYIHMWATRKTAYSSSSLSDDVAMEGVNKNASVWYIHRRVHSRTLTEIKWGSDAPLKGA